MKSEAWLKRWKATLKTKVTKTKPEGKGELRRIRKEIHKHFGRAVHSKGTAVLRHQAGSVFLCSWLEDGKVCLF